MTSPDVLTPVAPQPTAAPDLSHRHSADIAELMNEISQEQSLALLERLPLQRAIDVFDQPELENGAKLLHAMPRERAAAIVSGMASDRLVDHLRVARGADRAAVFALTDAESAVGIHRLLD